MASTKGTSASVMTGASQSSPANFLIDSKFCHSEIMTNSRLLFSKGSPGKYASIPSESFNQGTDCV